MSSTVDFENWEKLNNSEFNLLEFEGFLKEDGSNDFTLSPQKWANTSAKRIQENLDSFFYKNYEKLIIRGKI